MLEHPEKSPKYLTKCKRKTQNQALLEIYEHFSPEAEVCDLYRPDSTAGQCILQESSVLPANQPDPLLERQNAFFLSAENSLAFQQIIHQTKSMKYFLQKSMRTASELWMFLMIGSITIPHLFLSFILLAETLTNYLGRSKIDKDWTPIQSFGHYLFVKKKIRVNIC